MAFPTLSYDSIRALLDVGLTSTGLPDATIQLSVFEEKAKAEILERDPNADSYTPGGTQDLAIKRAAEYLTAALLAPAWVRKAEENWAQGDYSYRVPSWDPLKRAEQLRGEAEEEILTALAEVFLPDATFSTAAGTRGVL